jgi:hypothetical protein
MRVFFFSPGNRLFLRPMPKPGGLLPARYLTSAFGCVLVTLFAGLALRYGDFLKLDLKKDIQHDYNVLRWPTRRTSASTWKEMGRKTRRFAEQRHGHHDIHGLSWLP